MLSSYPESPLTPGVTNNFGLSTNTSPFAAYHPKFNNCPPHSNQYQQMHMQQPQQHLSLELPRLQNLQISPNNLNRFQASANQNDKNFLAPNSMLTFPLPTTTAAASFSRGASVSPIKSTPSANTSGYDSFSSSATSLEQLYGPHNMQINTSGLSAHFSPENQTFMPGNMSRRMSDSHSSFTFDNECRTPTPAFGLSVSANNELQIDSIRSNDKFPFFFVFHRSHASPITVPSVWKVSKQSKIYRTANHVHRLKNGLVSDWVKRHRLHWRRLAFRNGLIVMNCGRLNWMRPQQRWIHRHRIVPNCRNSPTSIRFCPIWNWTTISVSSRKHHCHLLLVFCRKQFC